MQNNVIIDEIVSQVRIVDGDSALTPRQMERIIRAVMAAMDERERHRQQVASELRLISVRDDLEREG